MRIITPWMSMATGCMTDMYGFPSPTIPRTRWGTLETALAWWYGVLVVNIKLIYVGKERCEG